MARNSLITICIKRYEGRKNMSSTLRTPLKSNRTNISQLQTNPVTKLDRQLFDSDKLIQIASVLQTTLDVSLIIELFAKEIKPYVRFDCIKYHVEKQNIAIKCGRSSRFSRHFPLELDNQPLGDITFTRRINFNGQETQTLKMLLKGLLYPIRNALMYEQALHDAHKDPLTGIRNRAAFNETIKREVELAQRHGNPLSMIMLDIDHFKNFNDKYGHYVGDCILKKLAQCTNQSIRGTDILYRYGGEEFVVLLPNTDDKGAFRLAQRIRRKIEKTECEYDGKVIKLTVSAGVSCLAKNENAHELFVKADSALYKAKDDGRNLVRVYV